MFLGLATLCRQDIFLAFTFSSHFFDAILTMVLSFFGQLLHDEFEDEEDEEDFLIISSVAGIWMAAEATNKGKKQDSLFKID